MSRILRAAILTVVLYIGAVIAIASWGFWLRSFESLHFIPPIWLSPYEHFLLVLVAAPVLVLLGGFAFWLYEPRGRTLWTLVFAAGLGLSFSYTAPSHLLRERPFILGLSFVATAALTMLLVVVGSWLAAKLLLFTKTRRSVSDA